MYMPPTVKTTYAAQYTDTSIALGTGAAITALKELEEGDREAGREKLTQAIGEGAGGVCLLYTSPSPRDLSTSRMPSSA